MDKAMIVKFLKDYPHTVKKFRKGAVVKVMYDFGNYLIKKKVAEEFTGEFKEDQIIKKVMEDSDGN